MPYQLIILKILIFIVGFIFIASLLQFLVSIHPPRYFSHNTPKDYNLKYEDVSFVTSDKINIKAWLLKSNKSNATVIIGHGYPFDKGNILPVVKFLYPEYNLLLYDHRYFGQSSGSITTVGAREIRDIEATVKFIREKFGKDEPIALYGFSLSASAMLMSKQDVKVIIVDSPYASLQNMLERTYAIFGPLKYPFVEMTKLFSLILLKINPDKISPVDSVKNIDIPILLIHGKKDSQISIKNANELKQANSDIELWIVDKADHGQAYSMKKTEYEKRIKDFLRKYTNES
jgi:uncharacterized protein